MRIYERSLFFLAVMILPIFVSAKIAHVPYEAAFCPDECPLNEIGMLFKSFYESYHNEDSTNEELLIPKRIHFIWLGSPVPSKVMTIVETWKKWHPGWTVRIWSDEDIPFIKLQNQAAFDCAINFGEKSDILRYEILYTYGGVYADIDFECLQSFDSLHQSCEFYTGINRDNRWLLNGLIGAKQGHPIIKACMDNLQTDKADHDSERIMQQTGPYYFTRMFLANLSFCKFGKTILLPPVFFYPFPAVLRYSLTQEEAKQQFVRPESLCIHYWSCSWQK